MTSRLDVLLGRLFAHTYATDADPVDWREARALWRAEQAQRLGLAPATTPYATATGAPWPYEPPAHMPARSRDEGPWAPIDYLDI